MKIILRSLKDLFSAENEFFTQARKGKRITHIAIAIPMVIVFLLVGFIISEGFLYQFISKFIHFSREMREFYNLGISFAFVILLVWLWVRFFEKRSFKTLGFSRKGALKDYIVGFFSGFIMLSIVIGLMAILGIIGFQASPKPFSIDFVGVMFLLLIGYVVQGASEEILARGWQFQVIGARYKPWLGAVISSIMFAFLHGLNTGVSVIAIINLILFAFLLIFFILYYRNIWAACGWHTAWNWAMENIFGLKVSGTDGGESIFNLSTDGAKYLTGGDFGPEGSILTTFVLIGGMIFLLVKHSKK